MPKTAQVVTRTNGVASLENLSKQNRAAPTDTVARLC